MDWVTDASRSRRQIGGPDPLLRAIGTAEPLLTLLHPPIELTGLDQVATSTGIGGSTTRRSAPGNLLQLGVAEIHI